MFYVERIDDQGNVHLMMASPHQVGIDDIRGPPGPSSNNQLSGAFYMNGFPSPGNKSAFAGRRGWQARVRYFDQVVARYEWDRVPDNPFDADSDTSWGWKLVEKNHVDIPPDRLWPINNFGG